MNNHICKSLRTRKRFGQVFLQDNSVIKNIVSIIRPQPNQAVIEIGPGLGAITQVVAKKINNMIAIELDYNLANYLATHPLLQNKIKVLQQDVMKVDFKALYFELGQPMRIFGNLPYNISTSIIFYLLKYDYIIKDMHFMLQKEVVNRLVASPNNKSYGRLSIIAQYYYKITPIIEVPSVSFKPVPKVNSVFVRFLPYKKRPFPACDLNILSKLINLAFSQRRKMLHNSLKTFVSTQQLKQCGIDTTMRAENLDIAHYCNLTNVIAKADYKKK